MEAYTLREALQSDERVRPGMYIGKDGRQHKKWWQINRLLLTKHEIPCEIVVKCDTWEEGLIYIAERNLNGVTGFHYDDCLQKIGEILIAWAIEGKNAPNKSDMPKGSLLHWNLGPQILVRKPWRREEVQLEVAR